MTKSGVHVLEVGPFFSPNMVQKGECCSQPTLSLLCGLLLSPRLCGRPRQGKSTRGRCRLGSWRLTRRWPRASRTASSARRSGRNPPALSPRNSPSLFWREALPRSVFALRVVMSSGVCALRLLLWLHFSVSLISLRLDKYKRGGDSSVNKRLTEIPDAILLWVWVSSVAIVFFSPRVNFQCRLSYGVDAAPMCNCMHQQLCAHQKSQTLAAVPLFGHTKILNTL